MRYQQANGTTTNHAQRIASACLMLFASLAALYLLPRSYLVIGLYLVAFQGLDEWCHLTVALRVCTQSKASYYFLGIQLLTVLLSLIPIATSTLAVLQWLMPMVGLISFVSLYKTKTAFKAPSIWFIGLLLQCCGWYEAVGLCESSLPRLLQLITATATADIAGYYAGRNLKLFTKKPWPLISPNKTYEGSLAMCIAPIIALGLQGQGLVLFDLCIGALALTGDLFMSSAKRLAQVKDCGRILPGHGGILDRLDSHLMVWTMHGALRILL